MYFIAWTKLRSAVAGDNQKLYIGKVRMEFIAEIGWNFMGDMGLAEKMVHSAKKAGATTVKFQYWDPAKLKAGDWDHDGRREIYELAKLNRQKILDLQSFASQAEIKFLISVFNAEDAKIMSDLDIKEIKIPSHEITNTELHSFCMQNFEKIYLSCGACTEQELALIVDTYGKRPVECGLVAMHCVSSYPCPSDKANLPRLSRLKDLFNCDIGLSDHTQSTVVPAISISYGCNVIEKHFTSDKELPGRDNKFAMVESEFSEMVDNCLEAVKATSFLGMDYLDIESQTVDVYRGRWG